MRRHPLAAPVRYLLAVAVLALLIGVSRATRALFGFGVDTAPLIIWSC